MMRSAYFFRIYRQGGIGKDNIMREKSWLIFHTAAHCIVDLACIYFLTGFMIPVVADHDKWLFLAVFYNMLAFALPMLTGLLADMYLQDPVRQKNVLIASFGCALVAGAYLLYRWPYPAVLLLGIGNGLFHIGGGRQILLSSGKNYASSGIFISSGAIGVYLGSFWGRQYYPVWNIIFAGTLICALVLGILRKKEGDLSGYDTEIPVVNIKKRGYYGAAVLVLLIVVCIRSYYGTILNYSWKNGFWMGLIFTVSIAGGKFFGGILADRYGMTKAIVLSLGTAAVTALFSLESAAAGCVSIFFFNMTMPLTLSLMYRLMKDKPGLAFGALMFALFLGTLPTMLYDAAGMFSPAGLCGMCLISLLLLLWEVKTERKCVEC